MIPETTVIGNRYRLHERLGAGGMGAVFRAEDRLTGQMLALKRVSLPDAPEEDTLDHLRVALSHEFRTLASLRHPNIISVIDYGFDAQRSPYFTMDLLRDARTLTSAGLGAPPSEQARLLAETLRALAYLHRRGVIHRDLKPGNVLVEPSGRVKVLDFGLALEKNMPNDNTTGMTGTLAYLAPELLTDSSPSILSDLYSVGVMAYEMFVGQFPYNMKNAAQLISQIYSHIPDVSPLPEKIGAVLARLLVKKPEERFQTADHALAALVEAVTEPLPPESLEIRESYIRASTFVGREEEMTLLSQALDTAFGGAGSAWLVGGESGVGKSRLLEELRIQALVKGALVLRGQLSQPSTPYELWREIVRRLVLSTPLSDLEAGVLRAIVPDIGALLGRTPPEAPPLDGRASHQRLVLTIADMILRQTQPVLLLLEDLQWAEESLDVLEQLLTFASERSWLIIGSYRDDEAPKLPEQIAGARVVKLARLSDAEIATLSEAMLGEAGKQEFVLDLIKKETEGNTFFITEVVRVLLDESGGMSEVGRATLPKSVIAGGIQDVVRRRMLRVPAWARPALRQAAVAGREINLRLLPALGVTDVEAWLTACANAAVIEVADGAWRFAHDKLRLFLLKEIAPDDFKTINRQIAEGIEVTYKDDPAYAERLTEHWRQAGEPGKAFTYALRAGEYLIRLTAEYDRAERLLHLALHFDLDRTRVFALLGEAALRRGQFDLATDHYQVALTGADAPMRTRIYNGLSEIMRHKSEWELATQYAQQALDLARQQTDIANEATSLSNIGSVLVLRGDFKGAKEVYEQALAIQTERGDRAAVLGNLGITLYGLSEYQPAIKLQEESLDLYREVGNRRGIALTYNRLATAYYQLGEFDRARGYYEDSLGIMRVIGDPIGMYDCLNNLGMLHYGRGRYEEAETRFGEALRVARQLGDSIRAARALNNLGASLKELGRYGDARAHMEEAISINRARNDERELAYALNSLGDLLVAQGRHANARAAYEESLALAVRLDDRIIRSINLASLGLIHARFGGYRAAYLVLAEALRIALDTKTKPRMAHVLLNTARVLHQQGRDRRAAEIGGVIETLGTLEGEHDPTYQQLKQEVRRETEWWSKGRAADPETAIADLIAELEA